MGGNQSTQNIMNETLNSVMINVMTKNSTSVTGSVAQSNTLEIADNTGDVAINGFTQSNAAKINISALAQSNNNASLQADLVSKLSAAVQQQAPALAINSSSTQNVRNIISNNIKQNMSSESLTNISAQVNSSNTARIHDNSGKVTLKNSSQSNAADLIMTLVDKTSNSIITAIKADSSLDSKSMTQPASILPDFGGAGGIIIIIIIILLCGAGYFAYSTGSLTMTTLTNPGVLAIIALVLVFLGYEAISSRPKEKK